MELHHSRLGHFFLHRLIMVIDRDPPLTLRVLMPDPATDTTGKLHLFLQQEVEASKKEDGA